MKRISLPDGTVTSQIGFGCANLIGEAGIRDGDKLIKAALDAGIRHFDVAPVYGSGLAESALGAALAGVSEGVTITTKVGIARPGIATSSARRWARRVLKISPDLKRKLGEKIYKSSRRTAFGIQDVDHSFSESLRRLRRDRVDVLLLHEPDPEDITDELIKWLERQRESGRAGCIGIGVKRTKVESLVRNYRQLEIVQTNWAAGDIPITIPDRFVSMHGAIRALAEIRDRLERHPTLCHRLSVATGNDLTDDSNLAQTLFDTALEHNRDGLVLFATSSADRIHRLTSGKRRPLPFGVL